MKRTMDDQEQKLFIRFLAKRLKKYRRELWVYQSFAETLRAHGYADVDETIEGIRTQPDLDDELGKWFSWIEELLPPEPKENQSQELLQYLEKWKPKGEPN